MATKTQLNALTINFNNALKCIFTDNIAEKVIIKISSNSISFYYAVKSSLRDVHRKYLKAMHCDTCVTVVKDEETLVRINFNPSNVFCFSHFLFGNIKGFKQINLEILNGLSVKEVINTFLQTIQTTTTNNA